jgi:peptidoglycan/LPS O-acetylase OafA/YrhL
MSRSKLLDNDLVAFSAKLSFGFYIWHMLVLIPVTDAADTLGLIGWLRVLLISSATFLITGMISWGSYFRFEEPLLERARLRAKEAFAKPDVIAVAGAR